MFDYLPIQFISILSDKYKPILVEGVLAWYLSAPSKFSTGVMSEGLFC
jgi:hypothetical protein